MEELGAASGTLWLHCDVCGHLWRRLSAEADAFSLILRSRTANAQPMDEARAGEPERVPRHARFEVRLAISYRQRGDTDWRTSTTENVSRSGVLFRADGPLDPQTPLELMLTLPGTVAGEPPSRLRCDGHVVRATTCSGGGPQPCLPRPSLTTVSPCKSRRGMRGSRGPVV